MRLLGEILTPLVFAAGLGINSIAAGGALMRGGAGARPWSGGRLPGFHRLW